MAKFTIITVVFKIFYIKKYFIFIFYIKNITKINIFSQFCLGSDCD